MKFFDRLVARDHRTEDDGRLSRRVAMVSTHELPLWLDNTISEIGKNVQSYLRDADPANLEEARIGAQTLVSLLDEVERRNVP